MAQQNTREEAACKERGKQLEAWVALVQVIGQLSVRLEAHTSDTMRWQEGISRRLEEIAKMVMSGR